MRYARRLCCLLLIPLFLFLLLPCAAAEDSEIETFDSDGRPVYHIPEDWTALDVLNFFLENYGLNEDNFALSFCCPETGEACAFNETTYMLAGSTYKLPLNMYYYEKQAEGVYTDDTVIGGMRLSSAHYQSVVVSANEISHALIYNLGSFHTYKQLMLEHYGRLREDEVESKYYADNYYCTKFMLNTLQYLYEHIDAFDELIGLMKQGMPGDYLQRYAGEIEVAHKYGIFEGEAHDVGIVFTEQPYLIAIYTQNYWKNCSPQVLIGRINAAFMAYQEQRLALERAAEEAARAEEEARREEAERMAEQAAAAEASGRAITAALPEVLAQVQQLAGKAAALLPTQPAKETGPTWYFYVFPALIGAGLIAMLLIFRKR